MSARIKIIRAGDSYIVQEHGYQPIREKDEGKNNLNYLNYAEVSVIDKDGTFLVLTEFPWKTYVRMGRMSEEFMTADIKIESDRKNAETFAFGRIKEIGSKLAKKRETELECLV